MLPCYTRVVFEECVAAVEAIQVQLKKGVLELCVLALLMKHDSYAYEIASTHSSSTPFFN